MFAVFLIAGEDHGQLRPGLANATVSAEVVPELETEPAPVPVLVAAAPAAPSADIAPVDTPVTVAQVTTPETAAEIADTVFSLANYGDQTAGNQTTDDQTAPDQSATAASGNVGYVDAQSVNVREGPGTDNPVLTRLGRGEAVTIVSTDGTGWARIRIEGDGIEGYMSMEFLSSTP